MNRQVHHNERIFLKVIGAVAVGALFLNGLSTVGAAPRSIGNPDTLVLRSVNSFSLRILSVDLRQEGSVGLRTCEAADALGGCKIPWRTSQKKLSSKELRALSRLTQEAKLFSGRANGAHIDLAFRWLEVRAHNDIAMLVVTLNDSFWEPGPRRMLLERLNALESQLSGPSSGRR